MLLPLQDYVGKTCLEKNSVMTRSGEVRKYSVLMNDDSNGVPPPPLASQLPNLWTFPCLSLPPGTSVLAQGR